MDKEPTKEAIDELKGKIALLNTLIGDKKYLTGDHVTLADYSIFIVGFYLENKCKSFDLSEFPNVKKWVETLSNEHPHAVEILSNLDGIEEFRAAIKQRMGLPK